LPLALQKDPGGWPNKAMADIFADYTNVVVKKLGDRVSHWVTINEPFVISELGHASGQHAPGMMDPAASVKTAHHLMLAHAKSQQVIKDYNKDLQVGIANAVIPCYPDRPDFEMDVDAARSVFEYYMRAYLDPIFKGRYPTTFACAMDTHYPDFDRNDLKIIHQPLDFLGVNHYTRFIVQSGEDGAYLVQPQHEGVRFTDMGWEIYPQGMYDILTQLSREYDSPDIYIMENGAAFKDVVVDGCLHDEQRIRYYKDYLTMVARAIKAGCKIKGYFAWSLFDNFEWAYGLEKRFGLVHVDYETQKRTIKDSGHWYGRVCQHNGI